MNSIIFLDLDGVLTIQDRQANSLDKNCCDRLKRILVATGAKIVVSSAWRIGHSLESLRTVLARGYEMPPILAAFIKDIGTLDPNSIIGMTPSINKLQAPDAPYGRGLEISVWLEQHPGIMKYCILDDESSDLAPHQDYLVKTNPSVGLTDKDVEKAINLLN